LGSLLDPVTRRVSRRSGREICFSMATTPCDTVQHGGKTKFLEKPMMLSFSGTEGAKDCVPRPVGAKFERFLLPQRGLVEFSRKAIRVK
jgi:hypothetical protein